MDAARLFKVSAWCITDWCTRDDLAPKQQSRRQRKLDWDALKKHTQDFPDAYLRERAEHFGVHIHAIEYALDQMKITRKKSLLYQERDHEQRIQYLRTVRDIVKVQGSDSLVYFDESVFESTTYRPHAYAIRGQKIHGNRSGKRGNRTNLILAKQAGRLLSPLLFTGSTNTAFVNEWVEHCLLKEIRPQVNLAFLALLLRRL